MTRLVILDFDGTMGDTRTLITTTMAQTIQLLGLPVRTPGQCAKTIGLPLLQCFTTLYPGIGEAQARACEDTYRQLFEVNNAPGIVQPFPGVLATIRQLHARGVIVTIASSRRRESVERYMREMGLDDIITYILGGYDVPHAKPHPDAVLATMRHFGIQPQDTLVVGDTEFDILMGSRAGALTCGVTYGNGSRESLVAAGADYVIDAFGRLLTDISSLSH